MSRYYKMSVTVNAFDPNNKDQIINAGNEEWDWEGWDEFTNNGIHHLSASGCANLCGGESEEEFSQRLTHAIWKANGKFCKVDVVATYMEDLPYEEYSFDEDDYQSVMDEG